MIAWIVGGALLAPFFSGSVDPSDAGLVLGSLSPFIGGVAFLVGRALDRK